MKKSTSTDKLAAQKYIYALIAVVLICIIGSIYKKKRINQALQQRALESAQAKLKNNEKLTPSERAALGDLPSPLHPKQWTSSNEYISGETRINPLFGLPPAQQLLVERSQENVKTFSKESYLNIPLPGNFTYSKLDLGDGFSGIYGTSTLQGAQMTGIAYEKVATLEQVNEFMKSDADSMPNLAKNPIQFMGAAEPLPPPPQGSGFGAGTMWNGKLANGENVTAVYIPRADKQGSYLFVLTGPDAYFHANDGAFDSVYENAKALPGDSSQK